MWIKLVRFIHHLFNPHCQDCEIKRLEDLRESEFCESCEILKNELALAHQREQNYINTLLTTKDEEIHTPPIETHKPINTIRKPWHQKRREMEEEDRKRANELRDNLHKEMNSKITSDQLLKINDLEKELGVQDG